MRTIRLRTTRRSEMVDITASLQRAIDEGGLVEGAVVAQSLHTTAALTLNEAHDPDVARDMVAKLDALVPHAEAYYRHAEGNSDGHVKTSLMGPSLTLLVSRGTLVLGTWQGVFLCEFDGPRERTVAVQLLAAAS